jgi:hypothetical protein
MASLGERRRREAQDFRRAKPPISLGERRRREAQDFRRAKPPISLDPILGGIDR